MDEVAGYGSPDAGEAQQTVQPRPKINSAPPVLGNGSAQSFVPVDPHVRVLAYNPKMQAMVGPAVGPENPFKTQQERAAKNIITGYVEEAGISDFSFEQQRRTFQSFGYAMNPTNNGVVGDYDRAVSLGGASVFDKTQPRPLDKRKREQRGNPGDLDNYKGPWAKYEDEKVIAAPTEEQLELLRTWKETEEAGTSGGAKPDKKKPDEKSTLHIKESEDYLGRSFMDIPRTVPSGVKLDSDDPPERCFLPDKCIHTWEAHAKGVSMVLLFPRSGHLILTAGMDGKVKLWEYYGKRRCIRTYSGHSQAVRAICFNNDGSRFLSASYDRQIKLWDTYSGECISRFSTGRVPYCVAFNPAPDKQHMFVAGMNDKKIVQWDINTGEIVQEYDRHLGAVNTVTFVDNGGRLVSTSDDKSIRVWEWEIPVDFKHIAEPDMHSIPSVGKHPNNKWLAMQSMDNTVYIYSCGEKFRANHKKHFRGHLVAGYACQVGFSADGRYVLSGDSEGKLVIWDWKTTKLYKRIKAHSNVCIGAVWHPHEPSQIITCSWDGTVKIWD